MGRDPSQEEKDRVKALESLAGSIEKVSVDKVRQAGSLKSVERKLSNHSELRFRFTLCVSGLENDNKDGVLLFPVQVSGFTSVISSDESRPPKRSSGSDFKKVKVTLTGVTAPKPKVKIDLPNLKHGSEFDAVQLARDEIIRRVRWFFPDADIEGRQKFDLKQFAIKNSTEDQITTWVYFRTDVRKENKIESEWKPNRGTPIKVSLPPKSTVLVKDSSGNPIEADWVKFWGESEVGDTWDEFRDKALPLIDRNPQLENARAYYDEQMQTYTYTITPLTGKRNFTERIVELQNETPESLTATLQYRTSVGGKLVSRKGTFTIPAQSKLTPRDDQGMLLRASQLRISGNTENRRYLRYADAPLWLVDEHNGKRIYQADRIGRFQFVFSPTGEVNQKNAPKIQTASAKVMSGSTQVGTLSKGTSVTVKDRRSGWIQVEAKEGNRTLNGWVREAELSNEPSSQVVPSPAVSPQKTLTITAASAAVKVGSATIETLRRGEQYSVLEERSGWARIELTKSGTPRQGWVELRSGQVR